ncbi:aspartate aminotransferase family protein [Saccharothrix obliqua]|uniref:aspartate aminotransferase family protein n=1 Tax=Saccharothrix obliqua TaxID=2861747 RepID=UPI001C602675|nr:aminotransferase class III-fold pyridoxal phosphate-dependent enzyme [Saccharothrix obliqua]MBW4716738.1 aminotransferase class III-fold pyridoxal phosphate-dependent enzyme [Saccharothrix obliqua]
MSLSPGAPEFADSHLIELLDGFGLAVKYVRAEGDTLYHDDGAGGEIGVLDLASGFGSLILGHHNPEIVAHAKQLLDEQVPVHAQFSGYSFGIDVAAALNRILRRELGTEEKFYGLFGNSGAEAVEIAIKHAEMDRGMKVAELLDGIEANLATAAEAVAGGAAPSAAALAALGVDTFDALAEEVRRRNAVTAARQPLFLALEGGFHGKLVSSIQLTYNADFRTPFKALAAQARFVPADRVDLAAKIVEEERVALLDVEVRAGAVELVERDFPVFAAFFAEPIMGEAGIKPLTADTARKLREVCDAVGVPLVADEIQSGMGRSGSFLASVHSGLRPDYVVLAKSLGGGIVKTGVVLVRESRYRKEFELLHTSTFGKDGFSSRVALKVLEMLEADDGAAYRRAAERGARARSAIEAVVAEFPDVLLEVRGQGLMLGVQFHDQSGSADELFREWSEHHVFAFALAGYLLHEKRIRIFSTASNPNTLRFEPSIFITDEQIDAFAAALRDVAQVVRDQDSAKLAR